MDLIVNRRVVALCVFSLFITSFWLFRLLHFSSFGLAQRSNHNLSGESESAKWAAAAVGCRKGSNAEVTSLLEFSTDHSSRVVSSLISELSCFAVVCGYGHLMGESSAIIYPLRALPTWRCVRPGRAEKALVFFLVSPWTAPTSERLKGARAPSMCR